MQCAVSLRFVSIHADMAAELALASSGMTTLFPCAIFLAAEARSAASAVATPPTSWQGQETIKRPRKRKPDASAAPHAPAQRNSVADSLWQQGGRSEAWRPLAFGEHGRLYRRPAPR